MLRTLSALFATLLLVALSGCGDDDCPSCPGTGAILHLSTHKIDFGANSTVATFTIINKGQKTLSWDITVNDGAWLDLSSSSGSDEKIITCTAHRDMLPGIGVSRATILINANGVNTIRDSIEVFILNAGEWQISDRGEFDTCWVVDEYDYYWVKGFALPPGMTRVFVDSVAFHFCEGDGAIQLLGFDSQWETEQFFWFPRNLTFASEVAYQVPSGWSVIPVGMFVSESPFFFGYLQTELTLPRPSVDTLTETDTIGSLRARDFAQNPNDPDLFWELSTDFQTLAIRVFLSPVIEYNPKVSTERERQEYQRIVQEALAGRGIYVGSVEPDRMLH